MSYYNRNPYDEIPLGERAWDSPGDPECATYIENFNVGYSFGARAQKAMEPDKTLSVDLSDDDRKIIREVFFELAVGLVRNGAVVPEYVLLALSEGFDAACPEKHCLRIGNRSVE